MENQQGQKDLSNMSTTTLTGSLWQRSKRKIPFLGRISKPKNGTVTAEDEVDAAKAAHARRREQVRRAQRNHRERKESYIKALEREFRTLRDEEDSITMETQNIVNENKMLRDIMQANGISFPGKMRTPSTRSRSPTVIKVIGNPGSEQRLQVSVDGGSDAPRIFPPNSIIDTQTATDPGLTAGSVVPTPNNRAANSVSQPPQKHGIGTNQYSHAGSTTSLKRHPLGLDATQVGVDFVLFLEHHCLQHARTSCANTPFSGHVLTFQTPLLSGGPDILRNNDTWEIPACHLDRLFDLAGALNLEGDITPVQAWRRIKQHPSFHKLTAEGLQKLAVSLREEVECYGFGAVVDEGLFNMYLEQTFGSL